ncbi:neuronal acetylcholine receptor subunit beta-3-like [Argopecten irradians]|uniref:neuronal acetylcholine receptor subunit beta-3-like n=1 Tax=Argopecten irradians TaxID=31199 RepID=UPI00371B0866
MKSATGIVFFWIIVTSILVVTNSSPTWQDVKNAYTFIFTDYDKRVRPVLDQRDTLNVSMEFTLNSINEFNEKSQKLVIAGWFTISWFDEKLNWNASDFNNVSRIVADSNLVWLPHIVLINTFGRLNMLAQSATSVWVDNDGQVTWFPADSYVVTCVVDITYYPFDTQTCQLSFEIWDLLSSEVSFVTSSDSFDEKYFEENVEWLLLSYEIERDSPEDDDISYVTYSLRLKRRPKFVIITMIAPVILLAFLNVCVFLIPSSSGEKNSFCVTVYLSYAVFLGIISSELPHSSLNVSYLAMYLLALLVFSVIIVFVTVVQVRLYIEYGDTPPPPCISWLLMCCKSTRQRKVSDKETEEMTDSRAEVMTQVLLKDVLPKLDVPLFCLFFFILFVMTLATIGRIVFTQSD